jgi:hypothetical protein
MEGSPMSALRFCLPLLAATVLAPSSVAEATAAQGSIVVEGHRLHSKVRD